MDLCNTRVEITLSSWILLPCASGKAEALLQRNAMRITTVKNGFMGRF
jgi:hypothetical protein